MRITYPWRAGALLCTLLVACTPGGERADPSPSAAPERGGTIEIGVLGEPETLDPYAESASELTYALARPVFPMPYRMLDDGSVEPDLAASLETTPRGALLTLADREWSNGRRIRPADVVASIRRARPPSGFAAIRAARVAGARTVALTGDVRDWRSTLATGAFVLPRGRLIGGNVSGGPFRFAAYQRGRRLAYEANDRAPEPPLLARLEVSFVQGTELLITLLERGELDAAWLPSTVNLSDRLDERGLAHSSRIGAEKVVLTFDPTRLSRAGFSSLVGEIELAALDDAFLRDDGSVAVIVDRGSGPAPTLVSLGAPEGDELLTLMQRAIQIDLEASDVTAELITGPVSAVYGAWQTDPPADVILRRTVAPRASSSVVVASVASYLAWRDGIHGLVVNPTLEGPLWNAREWWIEPSI